MSAKLYRKGDAWIIQALALHTFKTAREAREWARKNRLKVIRADRQDA